MSSLRNRFGALFGLSALGYLFGFLSQLVISYQFGANHILDGYWLGLALVNLLCFYLGPLKEALIPAMHRAISFNKKRAGRVLSAGIIFLSLLLAISSCLLWVATDTLLEVVGKGDNGFLGQIIPYLILYMWFFSLSETLNSVLISLDKSHLQMILRILSSLIFFAVVLWLKGAGINALFIGQISGLIFITVIGFVAINGQGVRYVSHPIKLLNKDGFFPLLLSLLVTYFVAQLYIFYERFAMNRLGSGLLSAFQYGLILMNVQLSLLVSPLSNLLWPKFLSNADSESKKDLNVTAILSTGLMCLILTATTSFLWLNAYEIICLIFGRGAFDEAAVILTAKALRVTIFSAIPIAFSTVMGRWLISTNRAPSYSIITGLFPNLVGIGVVALSLYGNSQDLIMWHVMIANLLNAILIGYFFCANAGFTKIQIIAALKWSLRVLFVVFVSMALAPHINVGVEKISMVASVFLNAILFLIIFGAVGFALKVFAPFRFFMPKLMR